MDSFSSPGTLRRTRSEPTATRSPTAAPSQMTSPFAGDGISTVALSVMTAASTVSSSTRSPILTCHSTTSASATPSPTSGSLITRSAISLLHRREQRTADARRTRKVVPLLSMGIRRVPTRHACDWRLQVIEACLLHERRKLRAESRCQCRLVDDDASARLADRCFDGSDVEREQGAKVDDFGVDAGIGDGSIGDIHHRSVSKHGELGAFTTNDGFPKRYGVVTVRDFAQLVLRPGRDGPVGTTVEGTIIEPLRLQEDDGIGIFNRSDEQTLRVNRIGRYHRLETANVRKEGFRALAMRLSTEDSTAGRHAHHKRAGELAVGAVAQPRRL